MRCVMRVLFTNCCIYCIKHLNVFDAVYELTLPRNSDKLDELENLVKNLDDLLKREADLINELKDIRKQKFSAQKQMKDIVVSISSKEVCYRCFFSLFFFFFFFFSQRQ